MSLSEREARARLQRVTLVDRSVNHKARVQRQKDELKARLRAEERERQSQKSSKDKRDSCLCLFGEGKRVCEVWGSATLE
jgi:hypothetical protein